MQTIGQPVATGASSILAGRRAPDPTKWRDGRREMDAKREYAAKFKDPRWQKKRLEILSRDNFTCQICFDNKSTLNVHHRWYAENAEPWDYSARALVTLCEQCHEEETIRLRFMQRDLVSILKEAGAMSQQFYELCCAFALATRESKERPLFDMEWTVIAWMVDRFIKSRFGQDKEIWLDQTDQWKNELTPESPWYEATRKWMATDQPVDGHA